MSEQGDVIAEFGGSGVLAGVRWAYLSAVSRSLETYSEGDGHDATWLGITRYTLFRDRLDRVFACERYAIDSGDEATDLDQLYDQLSEQDIGTMPPLDADLVRRSNLNGSPGWAYGARRFLLASGDYGKLDQLSWRDMSPTKQLVAQQRDVDSTQLSLFETAVDDAINDLEALLTADSQLDMVTLVVAHSLDPLSGYRELIFGRPRLDSGGGRAWHWCSDLLENRFAEGGRRVGPAPTPSGTDTVPDAPVRLRNPAAERRYDRASDEA